MHLITKIQIPIYLHLYNWIQIYRGFLQPDSSKIRF